MMHMANGRTLLVYNAGLSTFGLQEVTSHCNTSTCQVIPFDLQQFPDHVQVSLVGLLLSVKEAFCPRRRPHSGPIDL